MKFLGPGKNETRTRGPDSGKSLRKRKEKIEVLLNEVNPTYLEIFPQLRRTNPERERRKVLLKVDGYYKKRGKFGILR